MITLTDVLTILLEGLILGLTIGTSCLINCLPVLLAHITADHPGWKNGFISSVSFSLGRLLAYTSYALLFGLTGYIIDEFVASSTLIFIIFTIILVVFLLVYGLSLAVGEDYFPSLSKKVCAFTQTRNSSLLLGILIGLFPCGPLFLVFAQAIVLGAESLLFSFLYFLVFWSATNLYIFIAGLIIGGGADYIRQREKIERIKRISGFILVLIAVFHLLQLVNLF